jgi:hypothetical protein
MTVRTARFAGLFALSALFGLPLNASAQTATTYQLTDSANAIWHMRQFACASGVNCIAHVPIDDNGNAFGVSANPFFITPAPGATFWPYTLGQQVAAASVPIVLTAAQLTTLTPPTSVAVTQATGTNLHMVCDSGCSGSGGGGGTSSNFGLAFPAAGTALGVSNGTDMVAITLGQALAANSLPVALPATQITALTPPTSVGVNNLPAIQPISAASGAYLAGALANGASVAQGSTTDAPCTLPASATACSQVATEKAIANALNGPGAISQTTDGTTNGVRLTSQYPSGATAVQGSTTGTTAATSTTMAATASVTNFVCQISIRANATAAATGNATLSDGTKTYNFTQWTAPAASGLGVVEEIFNPCYPASATNTAWTLTSAAPGTGGVVSVAISGYQK